MRLASFRRPGGAASFGAIVDGGAIDLGVRQQHPSLIHALRAGALSRLADLPELLLPDYPLDAIEFLPPIPDPEKIICVGVNYSDRNAEYRDESELPKYPSLFVRFPGSFVGHRQPIVRPRESEQLDYEGEIVLVIGGEGRRVPKGAAHSIIAGLTLANEGSVRDWLRHGKFNVTQGKNFDASGSLGPWMTTGLDLTRPLRLVTRVNGEVRQDDTTASMIFDFAALIEYITTFTTLRPGDIILSGTPTGAGARFDPPRWLKAGDVVEVEVPEIGTLLNPVADEGRAGST